MKTSACFRACLLVACIFGMLRPPALSAQEETGVTCPGFSPLHPGSQSPDSDLKAPPTLIVLGTVVKSDAADPGPNQPGPVIHVKIDQVLYGHCEEKEVAFTAEWEGQAGERAIYYLSPSMESEKAELTCSDTVPVTELAAARALCDNVMDAEALGCQTIFVGTEASPPRLYEPPSNSEQAPLPIPYFSKQEVKIVRQISGPPLEVGATITVFKSWSRPLPDAAAHPGECLYFVSPPVKAGDAKPADAGVYPLWTVQSLAFEDHVKKTLATRGSDPVTVEGDRKIAEILFRGTVDEAVALLASDLEPAQQLGKTYLLAHPDEGRKALVDKISASMFTTGLAKDGEYRIQKRTIDTLDALEVKSPADTIPGLVEKMLVKLEKETPAVEMPARDESKLMTSDSMVGPYRRMAEERTMDLNHPLTWLLSTMDEDDIARRWGARLRALHGRLSGYWQHEVDLAIDVARIDQNEALQKLTLPMRGTVPIRFEPAYSLRDSAEEVCGVTISADGKTMATRDKFGTVCVRDMSTWKPLASISDAGELPVFSPDGKFVYVKGGNGSPMLVRRYEWRSGKLDREYKSGTQWIHDLRLSSDGATMATSSYMDGTLLIWDTDSAKVIRTVAAGKFGVAAMTRDGKAIAYITNRAVGGRSRADIVVESIDGSKNIARIQCDFETGALDFTPDGRQLICGGTDSYGRCRMDLFDLAHGGKRVASAPPGLTRGVYQIIVSPSGKYAALYNEDRRSWICRLPSLKEVWSAQYENFRNIEGIAFSPDEKMLAVANGEPTPQFISMETFKEVIPYAGHPTPIEALVFSPDGKQLTSVGGDDVMCHWDSATMKMTGRSQAGQDLRLASIEPHGDYAAYILPPARSAKREFATLVTIDLKSGKTVSSIGAGIADPGKVFWLPGGRMLLINASLLNMVDYLHGKIVASAQSSSHDSGDFYFAKDGFSLVTRKANGRFDKDNDKPSYKMLDISTGHEEPVQCTEKDGVVVASGREFTRLEVPFTVNRWNQLPPPVKNLPSLRGIVPDNLRSVVSSPDGRYVARAVQDDKIDFHNDPHHRQPRPLLVVIYDAATMKPLYAFHPANGFAAARFSPDATRLAVAGEDGSIEMWPMPKPDAGDSPGVAGL